ncbi:MAG: NAD(P)-dependent oxidoreductase [Pseudomonadota bacterium]|nr:NAD(P)-dependent oxidoreductase [Pseudomonadota bacterium]
MAEQVLRKFKLGWIGTGRMGFAMAQRLLERGADVAVWNRTRSKAEPLMEFGATVVDNPSQLADRDIVFTMVGGPSDFVQVTLGDEGVLSRKQKPAMLIDSTSIDEEASAKVRVAASDMGVPMLAAPVSGNAKVVKAGKLTFVVSGPEDAYMEAKPYLDAIGRGSSYVGKGELSRFIKICHNVFLGVVIQNMVEITVLAEKAGVPRHAFLDFLNNSVMGSMFSKYKSPALVNLDYSVTFTPKLLLKDLDLGLAAARATGVPMPVTAAAREIVQSLVGNGYTDKDFAALLSLQAAGSGLKLHSEHKNVSDGLSD